MNDRQKLLRKISVAQFAAWEIHLYLDTHPCDTAASEMFRKYTDECNNLKNEYETKFGPLTTKSSEDADWLNSPWPWENERSCE